MHAAAALPTPHLALCQGVHKVPGGGNALQQQGVPQANGGAGQGGQQGCCHSARGRGRGRGSSGSSHTGWRAAQRHSCQVGIPVGHFHIGQPAGALIGQCALPLDSCAHGGLVAQQQGLLLCS